MMGMGRLTLLFAVAAALATASPAAAHTFHSEVSPTIVLGEQLGAHVFESPGNENKINCPKARFQGTMSEATASRLTFDALYEECTLSGQISSPVTMNGCRYVLYGETDANGHGRFEIVCPAGKAIQIDMGTVCTVTIVPQAVQGVSYANEGTGSKRDLRITLTAGGISYSKTGFLCASVFGNGKDLQLTGTFTAWGHRDLGFPGEQVGIRVE
jgi:hypothetical protein